jgi:ribokinase
MKKIDIIVANGHGVGEYCYVKKIPVVGETARASNKHFEEDAGKGTNVAVAIARMGGRVAFLGKAGQDEAGRLGVKWMSEAGVDISHFWLDPNIDTDLGLVVVAEDGTNLCIDFDNDLNNLQISEAEERLPILAKDARYLISGFSISVETSLYVLKRGKELGLITLFNPSPLVDRTQVPDLFFVDYLFINETEASIMLDLPKGKAARDYIAIAKRIREAYHVENVIITLGGEGSVAYTENGGFSIEALKVKMVDQTGAGDGFMAAVTWRLSQGDNLKAAMEWASVYCGYLVTQVGSLGTYPKQDKIQEIFASIKA